MTRDERLATANAALKFFAPETTVEVRMGRVWVCWTNYRGEATAKPWASRGQSFYPVWSHKWGHGGTCCTALSQLVRFIQGRPLLPISTWRWWASPTVALGRDKGDELVATLLAGGYPEHVKCVLCEREIDSRLDWWHLDDVSGPCCGWTTGCRQRPSEAAKLDT
jgi:hypothetical protein